MAIPKVSVVVLNYNKPEDTLDCIQSVMKSDYQNLELIVVDNFSSESLFKVLEEKVKLLNIKLIRTRINLGYAGGNNVGIKNSTGKYILILNDDVIIDDKLISELVKIVESDNSIGVVGPIVYRHETNEAWFYTPKIKELNVDIVDVWLVVGCTLMIKRQVIEKIGLLDENFFMYHEEWDWCIRARKAGYRTVCAPKSEAWHKAPLELQMFFPNAAYFGQRNYFIIAGKHCRNYRNVISFLFRYLIYSAHDHTFIPVFYGTALKKKKYGALKSYLRGTIDGIVIFLKIRNINI